MNRKTDFTRIQDLIREAQVEREAHAGMLIGEALAAAWHGLARATTAVSRLVFPKRKVATR